MAQQSDRPEFNDRQKLAFWLMRASARLRAAIIERFEEDGQQLSAEQFGVLEFLWRRSGEPVSQRLIAESLGRSPAAVSRLLDMLESRGFVRRDAIDKRTNAVSITEAGQRLHEQLGPILDEVVQAKLGDVSDRDLETVMESLKKIAGFPPSTDRSE